MSYWSDAIGSMWRKPEVWADAEVEFRNHSEVKQMMAPLKQWFRGDKQSKFEICDRDEIAGEDESILEGFPDDPIYLGADQEGTAVLFRWPGGITYLIGGDILTKASNDIETYAYHEPLMTLMSTDTSHTQNGSLKPHGSIKG